MSNTAFTATNSEYLNINPTWHIEDSAWKATQILKMLERNKLQPKTVVEIGCGAGEILNQLHGRINDKSIEFSGYEIAPDAFKLCLERQKERLVFYQEDLLQTSNKYDLLLMIDVFEHVDDYLGFIKKAGQKATYKIYHIPLDMSVYSILINNFKHVRKPGGHIHYYNQFTALATLKDSGQEVIDWFYTKTALEVHNKNISLFTRFMNFLRRIGFKIKPDFTVKTLGGFSLMVLTKEA
ncbi:class I SAM-dependent methyltransferase [Ferruginibacter sp.]